MKIQFESLKTNDLVERLQKLMDGRKFAEIVNFQGDQDGLNIIIKKFGQSELRFSREETDSGVFFTLASEKIAFAHRAFKDEVTKKILSVIEQAGGKVIV